MNAQLAVFLFEAAIAFVAVVAITQWLINRIKTWMQK